VSADCQGLTGTQFQIYRTWFYFSVECAEEKELKMSLCNLNNNSKMFNDGYKIVYKKNNEDWKRYDKDIRWQVYIFLNRLNL
jgi:hypothetical protein